jgi:hypothetical protein
MTVVFDRQALQKDLARAGDLAAAYADAVHQRFGKRVGRVMLYGSAVRGDWTPESDIDVLVTLDRIDSEDGDWLSQQAFRMGILGQGLLLQPVFMPEREFVELLRRERAYALSIEAEGVAL